jgi:hypothetical protein
MQTLKPIVLYQNPSIIRRIQTENGLGETEATVLFEDTKKFLALSTVTTEKISPTSLIDKGWHVFLMFSKEYAEFCYIYLGKFVHHAPFDLEEKNGRQKMESGIMLAKQHFNDLSFNWVPQLSNGDCSPDSNCESAPSDCALNIANQQFAWPLQQ